MGRQRQHALPCVSQTIPRLWCVATRQKASPHHQALAENTAHTDRLPFMDLSLNALCVAHRGDSARPLAAPRSHSPFPRYPEALLIFTSVPFIVSDRQGWLPGDRGYFKQQARAHGAVSRALSHCAGQLVCTQWSEGAEAKKTSCGLREMKER